MIVSVYKKERKVAFMNWIPSKGDIIRIPGTSPEELIVGKVRCVEHLVLMNPQRSDSVKVFLV